MKASSRFKFKLKYESSIYTNNLQPNEKGYFILVRNISEHEQNLKIITANTEMRNYLELKNTVTILK